MSFEQFRIECENKIIDLMERVEKLKESLNGLQRGNTDDHIYIIDKIEKLKEVQGKSLDLAESIILGRIPDKEEFNKYIKTISELKEKLVSQKQEIPSENLRTCSECQKIFESIELRKEHEKIIHGLHLHNPNGTLKKSKKKEYIASLNDPKAFEAVNLGILERTRVIARQTECKHEFDSKDSVRECTKCGYIEFPHWKKRKEYLTKKEPEPKHQITGERCDICPVKTETYGNLKVCPLEKCIEPRENESYNIYNGDEIYFDMVSRNIKIRTTHIIVPRKDIQFLISGFSYVKIPNYQKDIQGTIDNYKRIKEEMLK